MSVGIDVYFIILFFIFLYFLFYFFSVCSHKAVHPHTIHIHNNDMPLKTSLEDLTAVTLMNLFAHAASYAVTSGLEVRLSI